VGAAQGITVMLQGVELNSPHPVLLVDGMVWHAGVACLELAAWGCSWHTVWRG
jgi:hypothetical protein